MSDSFSLYITVNRSKQIINGLHQHTTVQEVINRLAGSCSLRRPQILIEVWKNCSRPLHPQEKLCESFSKWGSESRNVTLKMVDSRKFGWVSTYKERKRKRKRMFALFNDCRFTKTSKTITGAQRILMRKYPVAIGSKKSKRNSVKRLQIRLKRLLDECDCEIKDLQYQLDGIDDQEEELSSAKKSNQEIISNLNPQLQAEYVYLKKGVAKHRNSSKELEKHKKELEQSISNRQSEILSLETNVETTQGKVLRTQHCLCIQHTYIGIYIQHTYIHTAYNNWGILYWIPNLFHCLLKY